MSKASSLPPKVYTVSTRDIANIKVLALQANMECSNMTLATANRNTVLYRAIQCSRVHTCVAPVSAINIGGYDPLTVLLVRSRGEAWTRTKSSSCFV